MSEQKYEINKLSSEATMEAVSVGEWTKSENGTFESVNGIDFLTNKDELINVCGRLLKTFRKLTKSQASKKLIAMIHVQQDQSTVLPVEKGWEIDFIPVRVVGGKPSICDEELGLGFYAHLRGETEVTGDMYAVLLLSQKEQ